jgi:hypothetical protein
VVDDKNGLITHAETVSDATDISHFTGQTEHAHETMEKPHNNAWQMLDSLAPNNTSFSGLYCFRPKIITS